ncbi:signal peptidase I [Leptotrichia sp. OH3620_COT-345]|uniref:signal peptidase I n=1 Tax=Leptotrichia sp. OH3620_COT-345 TaxID=2491048 RepID=UPI000F64A7D8|nr:signal peptidase I [Leptotrichia sp. OH3620_COT-345]RRD40354.1 signal peptidase I [Leptotrichia sp. OH3620_COT-345]
MKKIVLILTGVLLLIGFTVSNIIINISESSPTGIYIINRFSKNYKINDYIVYETPKEYKKYADKKLQNLPALKKVKAAEGDKIEITENTLFINGKREGILKYNIPSKIKNNTLKKEEYFTFSENENSLDSRYYGVIDKEKIKYKAYLLLKLGGNNDKH